MAAVYVHNPAAVRYRVIDLLQQLVELYPANIWKEDFLLFPLAQQNLSPAEQNLEEKFESVERELCTVAFFAIALLGTSRSKSSHDINTCEQCLRGGRKQSAIRKLAQVAVSLMKLRKLWSRLDRAFS